MLMIIIWLKHECYKENIEVLLVASTETGLEVSAR